MKRINLYFGVLLFLIIASCGNPQISTEEILPTSTPAPMSTAVSSPTMFPTPTKHLILSPDTANTTPPEDIIKEVSYFGRGLGPGGCNSNQAGPYKNDISMYYEEYELMQGIWGYICNTSPNKKVEMTIKLPDGSIENKTYLSDESGNFLWEYAASLESPVGTYTFAIATDEAEFETVVEINKPEGTRLYLDEDKNGNRILIFYNFLPNEKIRLFAYRNSRLEFWQEFIADENGMLVVKTLLDLDSGWYEYASVGETSGVVYYEIKGYRTMYDSWDYGNIYCEGAPNPVSIALDYRYVEVISDKAYLRYKEHDKYETYNLPKGTVLQLMHPSGPTCEDNAFWWYVMCAKFSNGESCTHLDGLVAEKIGDEQFIRSIEDGNYDPSQETSEKLSCDGLESRMAVGDRVRVVYLNKIAKRIRKVPGFTQDIISTVPEGYVMDILDGPQCVDGNTWWLVHTENGLEGWMVEDQDGVYLLEPVQ